MEDKCALTAFNAHPCLGPAPGPLQPAGSGSTCTPDSKDSAYHKGMQGQLVVGLLKAIDICGLGLLPQQYYRSSQQQQKHSS